MNENRHLIKQEPQKKRSVLKENSVYLNQSPVRQNKEKCALKNLELLSSAHTIDPDSRKNKSLLNEETDFGGWDEDMSKLPKYQSSRKSCSQQAQRIKQAPQVQVRKKTPQKVALKMAKVPSPVIEYPLPRRMDTLNAQLMMLHGLSEYFGNERFNRMIYGMNSIVLSRRVKRGTNRLLSSKSFL